MPRAFSTFQRVAYFAYLSRILRPGISPFRLSVHSNQLAIAEVSLLDATVADAREQMQVLIGAATRAIDRALDAEAAA